MGFRDINAFNLAVLAKQAWHLIHGPHSLFYCVYKARYFPTCSFLDVELGNNPSCVWQSLLQARDIIREALYGKLGMVTVLGLKVISGYLNPQAFGLGWIGT